MAILAECKISAAQQDDRLLLSDSPLHDAPYVFNGRQMYQAHALRWDIVVLK